MLKDKNLVKFGGIVVLSTVLAVGAGLAIYDTTIDHTKEVCPITQILDNGNGITLGVEHQQNQMNEESGLNYLYAANYERYKNYEYRVDVNYTIDENGNKTIFVPAGYSLVYIDGKPYGVSKRTETETVGRSLVAFDDNGEELGCLKLG